MNHTSNIRILAIASGGGHWIQLRRMRPAWDGCHVIYVTTNQGYSEEVFRDALDRKQTMPMFYTIRDANRWQKFRLLMQLLQIFIILAKEHPDVVISTGAAPGFFAIRIGKMLGARTIWVDSIANGETLSLAGKKVGLHADLWLTQWKELAGSELPDVGLPAFKGSVI